MLHCVNCAFLPTQSCAVTDIDARFPIADFQLLTEGTPEFLLQYCSEYWDGREVRKLTSDELDELSNVVAECRARDMYCIAYAYRPVIMSLESAVLAGDDAITTELPFRRTRTVGHSKEPSMSGGSANLSGVAPGHVVEDVRNSPHGLPLLGRFYGECTEAHACAFLWMGSSRGVCCSRTSTTLRRTKTTFLLSIT